MNTLKQTLAGYRANPKSLVEKIPHLIKLWALVQLFLRIFTCYDGELCAPFLFKVALFLVAFAIASGLINLLWLLFLALLEYVWETLKQLPGAAFLIKELGPKDIDYFIEKSADSPTTYAKF